VRFIVVQKSLGGAAVAVWLFGQAAVGLGPTVLTIDAAESRVVIIVGKTGVFGFAGHAHEVVAPSVGGRVTFDPADWRRASVSLDVDASKLRVTGKGESPADVPEVQRVMLSGQVLDVTRFPKITFQSRRVSVTVRTATSADVLIEGDMTLHGTMRPMAIRVAVTLDAGGRVTARGSFSLKQTEFGMVPVTAVGGAVRVKDELDIEFVLKANPSHETHAAH
jgi:polyisoprenoid-binding protein YceI